MKGGHDYVQGRRFYWWPTLQRKSSRHFTTWCTTNCILFALIKRFTRISCEFLLLPHIFTKTPCLTYCNTSTWNDIASMEYCHYQTQVHCTVHSHLYAYFLFRTEAFVAFLSGLRKCKWFFFIVKIRVKSWRQLVSLFPRNFWLTELWQLPEL